MNILQFLQEHNGDFSSTRLAMLLWVIGLLGVWSIGSIHNINVGKELLELPDSALTLVGILTAGKVVQKFQEEKSEPTIADSTTSTAAPKAAMGGTVQPTSVAA